MLSKRRLCELEGLRYGIVSVMWREDAKTISSKWIHDTYYEGLGVNKVQKFMDGLVDDGWLKVVSQEAGRKTYSLSLVAKKIRGQIGENNSH